MTVEFKRSLRGRLDAFWTVAGPLVLGAVDATSMGDQSTCLCDAWPCFFRDVAHVSPCPVLTFGAAVQQLTGCDHQRAAD